MEEKERFTNLHYLDDLISVYDNKLNSERLMGIRECFDLLNQQDKHIKELEKIRDEGNQKLENFYNEKIDKLDNDYNRHFDELIEENQQLKEQLFNEEQSHDLCIKSFEEETEKLRKQIKTESDARERFVEKVKQLKQGVIVPKFMVSQTLFRLDFGAIVPFIVNEIYVHIKADKTISIQYFDYVGLTIEENDLFATKEEAEQKLAKIKGK